MTKRKIHIIFSIFLVALFLLSSSGLSIDAHYCQNNLKGISFFGKAKSCHDKKAACPLHETTVTKNDCCSNKTIAVQSLDDDYDISDVLQAPSLNISSLAPIKIALPKIYKPSNTYTAYIHYRPPPLVKDVQSQFATYLI